jgi:hypothetical protein
MKLTLITMRLKDMRRVHPQMTTGKCGRCGEDVGIYPSGQKAIEKYEEVEIVCHVCRDPGAAALAPGAFEEPWESEDRNE